MSESRQLAQILILFHFFYTVCCYHLVYRCMYTEGYSESTEPIYAVNILPLSRFEPTTSATPPSTTPDINATNCATESFPKKDVQEALILMTTDAVHVYVVLVIISYKFNKLVEISFNKFHMK